MIWIGLDDTDNLESRGTGSLARQIAAELAVDFSVMGVTRHQLSSDPRVPRTHKNSCAAIHLEVAPGEMDLDALLDRVRGLMLADFQTGSDPGLCIAEGVPAAITDFGQAAKEQLVTQTEARALASAHGVRLVGLGGDEDGVIGALAAVGLAAGGDDGRYIIVGKIRELAGLQPLSILLAAGVSEVRTLDGRVVQDGLVQTDKLRPARREGQPIAVVEWHEEHWLPLKLD